MITLQLNLFNLRLLLSLGGDYLVSLSQYSAGTSQSANTKKMVRVLSRAFFWGKQYGMV